MRASLYLFYKELQLLLSAGSDFPLITLYTSFSIQNPITGTYLNNS